MDREAHVARAGASSGAASANVGMRRRKGDAFLTKDNFTRCEGIFLRYMRDRHGDVDLGDIKVVRKALFTQMQQVRADNAHEEDFRRLNNLTLNRTRDMFMYSSSDGDRRNHSSSEARSGSVLDREREVYGNRPVEMSPQMIDRPVQSHQAQISQDQAEERVQRMLAQRRDLAVSTIPTMHGLIPPPSPEDAPPQAENVENRMTDEEMADVFAKMERARSTVRQQQEQHQHQHQQPHSQTQTASSTISTPIDGLVGDAALTPTPSPSDPIEPFPAGTSIQSVQPLVPPPSRLHGAGAAARPSDFLQKRPVDRVETLRYVSINGFDRDWVADPYRYRYTVRVMSAGDPSDGGTLNASFRDVTAIQATCIMLPMEITPNRYTIITPDYVPDKPTYQHEFSFSYPYVILALEGLEGVYEGTNDNVRRAFCQFKYEKHYKAPNGRGYLQLKSMQDEVKRFFPSPLASLRDLRLSIQKPNGTPFNNSRDDYRLVKVEYQAYNATALLIVLDKWFDRNEFFLGDTVAFRGVTVDYTAMSEAKRQEFSGADRSALDRMLLFLNRKEGHEILEVGGANDKGYIQSFYVFAPGTLDQEEGELVLDEPAIAVLDKFNVAIQETATDTSTTGTTGAVLNASLQNTVSMRVWTADPDPSALMMHPQN